MGCQSFQEVVKIAQKPENAVKPVIELGLRSSAMEDVDHDAVWRASLNEVPQRRAHAAKCSVIECDGYSEWWRSSTRSTLHVHVREG